MPGAPPAGIQSTKASSVTESRSWVHGTTRVTRLPSSAKGAVRVGEGPYVFYWVPLDSGTSCRLDRLASCTVLCKAEPRGTLELASGGPALADGDTARIENVPLMLTAAGGRATALVAGTETAHSNGRSITVARSNRHYRVSKPWGHELWFNEGHPACLKELFIRAGNRTSLHYHERKEETILVFSGRMRLVFKDQDGVDNDAVSADHLGKAVLSPISAVHVPPGVLHRLEAVTDVLLYEAATPHPDDVIRVQDDTKRPDGRVASEHGT